MRSNSQQFLGFNDLWFRLIMIPIIGAIVPVLFFQIPFSTDVIYFRKFLVSTFYTTIYWHACRWIFIQMNQRYPNPEDTRVRIIKTLLYSFAVIIFFCPIFNFLAKILVFDYLKIPVHQYYNGVYTPLFGIYAANVTMFAIIAATYESIRNLSRWEQTIVEKEALEKAHIASQLEGLKSQVNPHFLFNSLNTLISIIPEDAERSVRFVRQLSKIYRYFLETTNEKTVSLQQEMDFVNSYTFLLKERFGESLHIDVNAKNACNDCVIIPFSLQLLLENCIKHNIISQDKPLYINILVNPHEITIKNNFQPKNQTQNSTGVGLKNIESRYQLLSDKAMKIEQNEQFFSVTLPLLVSQ
jgi:two-component system, LytTR family, sensor kinase